MVGDGKGGWLDEIGKLNVVVIFGAAITLTAAFITMQIGQDYMEDRIATLEAELETIASRRTEIAQMAWKMESMQNDMNRQAVQIESLQETVRETQSAIRDLQRMERQP